MNEQAPSNTLSSPRSALWLHMHDEHGLTLLESELDEIERLAKACPADEPTAPASNWLLTRLRALHDLVVLGKPALIGSALQDAANEIERLQAEHSILEGAYDEACKVIKQPSPEPPAECAQCDEAHRLLSLKGVADGGLLDRIEMGLAQPPAPSLDARIEHALSEARRWNDEAARLINDRHDLTKGADAT